METRYTDDYPDIKKLKETIAALEKLKKDMAAEAKENVESNQATPAQLQAMAPLIQLKTQMKLNPWRSSRLPSGDRSDWNNGPGLSGAAECYSGRGS